MFKFNLASSNVCVSQDNRISIWSIGSNLSTSMEDGFEGDPQLICEHKHDGDVLDLQVSYSLLCVAH